ncbi:MAG: SUMF1/EgtB/PvdO family nonheme iron enzyme [Deltaproteobacteria bacterium]|jgi:formylglycine-generating enzyme required for sulfatase activity|nr:SUMF1/EgtB/PvdO family nonheme iron enzyme [Deltaproteobacteria bacterium]MDA8305286.1 SUMF1/EgtB/PvdO family nonheme iron enzyme [Deltaproteobacteria bacterium]
MRCSAGKKTLLSCFLVLVFWGGVASFASIARSKENEHGAQASKTATVQHAPSAPQAQPKALPIQPDERTALVIGNANYASGPLRNPVNDAEAMAKTLRTLSFDVTLAENLDQKQMNREIEAFGAKLRKRGGVGLFYFAGHGVQLNGHNYLIPVDASIQNESQVVYQAVDMGEMLSQMAWARNRMNIVIMDACRDNPFAQSFRSLSLGLASVVAPAGTLIAYSTAPGSVANDGTGKDSIYTGALIRAMVQPGLQIEDVFKRVRLAVSEATGGKQVPWESSSLIGDFYFVPLKHQPTRTVSVQPQAGPPAPKARPPAAQSASRGETPTTILQTWKEPVTGLEFVWIPPGCFLMGSPQGEKGRSEDEGPVHQVCVDGFWMSRTDVTNAQFRLFQKDHNSGQYHGYSLNGNDQPAVEVSWHDANNFCQWLTGQNGGQYHFRLPTEAEWEYASRAGTETSRYWGDDSAKACVHENVADYTAQRLLGLKSIHQCDDGYATTAPVGSFRPNPFGLYDMLGNVKQWCDDVYSVDAYVELPQNNPEYIDESKGQSRVIRGASWHAAPDDARCAKRRSGLPDTRSDDIGFRIVRSP